MRFDGDDRLRSYALNKRTCGAEIGDASLLIDIFKDKTPDQLLDIEPVEVLNHFAPDEETEFLFFKHLVAVKEAIRVYIGRSPGTPSDPCTISSVSLGLGGAWFEGLIAIDAVTDEINACGNCGSCGSR